MKKHISKIFALVLAVCMVCCMSISVFAAEVTQNGGNGAPAKTDASSATTQTLIKAPIAGCYMTGVGDLSKNTAAINYAAIVTPLSNAVANATVASVVFVIEWDSIA